MVATGRINKTILSFDAIKIILESMRDPETIGDGCVIVKKVPELLHQSDQ